MKTILINTDDNGNKWYDVGGVIYGLTCDARLLDCDGIPYQDDDADALQILESIIELDNAR